MRENIVIIGECGEQNKAIGNALAVALEINYLDFDDYCDYINNTNKVDFIKNFGKREYNKLQKDALPHMRSFCESVIGFDGKISRLPSVYKCLCDRAYVVCIASRSCYEKYVKYADIWVDIDKNLEEKLEEIEIKLGEIQ